MSELDAWNLGCGSGRTDLIDFIVIKTHQSKFRKITFHLSIENLTRSFNQLAGQAKRRATTIRCKAVAGGILAVLFRTSTDADCK